MRWSMRANSHNTIVASINTAMSIIWKLSGVTEPKIATGRPNTIQILKMLLPTILPISNSVSPLRAALIVVTSSGREVPSATTVRAIIRSEMPILVAMLEAELTTNSLPPATPARPMKINRIEMPSLCLGGSTSVLSLVALALWFLRVILMI